MKKNNLLISVCVCFGFVFICCSGSFAQTGFVNPNTQPNNPRQVHNSPPYVAANKNNNTNKNTTTIASNTVNIAKNDLPEIMAIANNEQITRKDVVNESLRIFGDKILKDLVKRTLVEIECRRRNIVITQADINAEVLRLAKAFNFSTSDWLELIERERGITAEQYMQDIICPILGLAKLAGDNQVTNEDLQRAYESKYGASVQVRQIVLRSKRDAQQVHAQVTANPESFPTVAKNSSVDPASQPYGGLIHPIRRYSIDKAIEDVVFSLREGQISPIVEWGTDNYIVFRCEKHLPSQNVDINQIRKRLEIQILDEKTRKASEIFFEKLLKNAKIEKVFGDTLRMSQKPGVAAIVNDHPIAIELLANLCVRRYGNEVLGDMINRLIIVQECRKNKIVINEQDIDMEIREMAIKNLPLKENGSPNVELWMKLAMEESGMTAQVYRTNTVFPMLALKRLSKEGVQITNVDLQRSYESNFGEKVRCLAITFEYSEHRRAIEVWNMAKMNPNENNFRELSEKYSSDPALRLSSGVIPLICKHAGDPELEGVAFKLQVGELSQIINVGDNLMILLCVGKEPASNVAFEDTKPRLIEDLLDKKQKLAVTLCYENLYKKSVILNYLASTKTENGTTQKFDPNQPAVRTANPNSTPVTPIVK
ncbi:MAG: peptidylprolyl isomerase [Planctomycetaceae bacterium]|jgi:parvulin-like peptidyl-prolyl isomerase|nr:peptidylprolyl isomerase [Planctomycetaceae bacterium]